MSYPTLVWLCLALSCLRVSSTAVPSSPSSLLPSWAPSSQQSPPQVSPAPITDQPSSSPTYSPVSSPPPSSLTPTFSPSVIIISSTRTPVSSPPSSLISNAPTTFKTSSPSLKPSTSSTHSPTVSPSLQPSTSPTQRKIYLERVMTEVKVEMAAVSKPMDYVSQNNLESILQDWMGNFFQESVPPIYGISTRITSQHLDNTASSSGRYLRSLQFKSGSKIVLRLILSGYFEPSPQYLSAADVNMVPLVTEMIHDSKQVDILLRMIEEYARKDPSGYFSNVFLFQISNPDTMGSNTTSSLSFHESVNVVIGTVGGFVGSVLAVVLILLWRDRRKRRGRRSWIHEKDKGWNEKDDKTGTQPNTPDREYPPDTLQQHSLRAFHGYSDEPSIHSHMDDSNGSIMDLTKFSIRDTSYIVRHRQDGNAVVDPCDDVDAEMRFRYDDVYSEMTTNDSVSLPSYSIMYSEKNRSLAAGTWNSRVDVDQDTPHPDGNESVTMTRLDEYSITPLSIIQELCDFKFEDDSSHAIAPYDEEKTESQSVRSNDSINIRAYDNYSVAAFSCHRTGVVQEKKDSCVEYNVDDDELTWNYLLDPPLVHRPQDSVGNDVQVLPRNYRIKMNPSFDESISQMSLMDGGMSESLDGRNLVPSYHGLLRRLYSSDDPNEYEYNPSSDGSMNGNTVGKDSVVSCIHAMGFFHEENEKEDPSMDVIPTGSHSAPSHNLEWDVMDDQTLSMDSVDMYSIAAETFATRTEI